MGLKSFSFPGPSIFAGHPAAEPLPRLPDWQAAWRDKAVRDEREACALLAEEHGAHAAAAEIRARGTSAKRLDAVSQGPCSLIPDPSLAHIRAMPSIGPAIEAAAAKALRDNPPPPDVLLPEGCTRWWPRLDVVDREEGLCLRLTWEAKR